MLETLNLLSFAAQQVVTALRDNVCLDTIKNIQLVKRQTHNNIKINRN